MNTTKSTGTAALLATLAMTAATACGAISVTIETVTIGNPGNNGDTVTMVTDGGSTGYGAVSYTYEIGTKEVTSGQYAAFLNAVAATDTYGLYNEFMDRTLHSGDYGCGITRSGAPGSYEYAVTEEYKDKPVNYVSVYDAMRYTNWLTNGQQNDATTTEYGVYLLVGGTAIPTNRTVGRNIAVNGQTLTGTGTLAGYNGTVWALASEDEWYKAAYYNVETQGYSLYPNGTSEMSTEDANYGMTVQGQDLTNAGSYTIEQNGTWDMAGNVWEWNDTAITQLITGTDITSYNARGIRGGAFTDYAVDARASSARDFTFSATFEYAILGFRVAALSLTAVPEPGTYAAATGLAMLVIGMWLRRGRRTGRG